MIRLTGRLCELEQHVDKIDLKYDQAWHQVEVTLTEISRKATVMRTEAQLQCTTFKNFDVHKFMEQVGSHHFLLVDIFDTY